MYRADALNLTWGSCKGAGPSAGNARDCAFNSVPLDPSNPLGVQITFFVRRYYTVVPTEKALIMIQGGPGDSTLAFDGAALHFLTLDPSLTVYLADNRGIGGSSPVGCPVVASTFDMPYWFNASFEAQYTACNAEVSTQVGDNAIFYSTHYAALDYIALFEALKLTGTSQLALYCLSYGTYFCNMILLHYELQPALGSPPDAIVLDCAAPATRWRLENSAHWTSLVADNNLIACSKFSATCRAHLGEWGQIPRDTMDSIIDGTLPCLTKLPWLTQQRATNLNADFQLGGSSNSYILNGPFWWRLYRCSDSDAEQLTFYNAFKEASQPAGFAPPAAYSYGIGIIVGANEVYSNSRTPLTYAQQTLLASRAFADAGAPFMALVRESGNGPLFSPVAETHNRIARPTRPLLIMDAGLDSNTYYGNGVFTRDAMGANATLVTVPWAWHGTLDPNQPCAASIIVAFLTAFGADPQPNTSCLANAPVPDYEGLGAAAKARAMSAFDTESLWND